MDQKGAENRLIPPVDRGKEHGGDSYEDPHHVPEGSSPEPPLMSPGATPQTMTHDHEERRDAEKAEEKSH